MIPRFRPLAAISIAIFCLFLSGCLWPSPPPAFYFEREVKVREGLHFHITSERRRGRGGVFKRGNALLVVADRTLFSEMQARIPVLRNAPTSLEEMTWWEIAPSLSAMYKKIWRVGLSEARYVTILNALQALEHEGEPYDVYFLTHGGAGSLSSGQGYFLSFLELRGHEGRFPNMNLVFSQSCFGTTLVQPFLRAGADEVIAFEGLQRNYFWILLFLRNYRFWSAAEAWHQTNAGMEFWLTNDLRFSFMAQSLGLSISDYLQNAPGPRITTR